MPIMRRRRLILGAPDAPRWARPALLGVLGLAAFLYCWALSINGYANTFYSAAVLSGLHSWKAFFYGALDAGSFITVDKPPLALWVQGLSARVFGFSSWSLLLPEAAAGVLTVLIVYHVVRRGFGYVAAIIASVALTLTPIAVAVNRDNNPDTLLVLLLVLAVWACSNAIRGGRLRWLLLSAAFVGLAFNTKMLQAFVIVPALAAAWMVAAPAPFLRRRLPYLLGAGVVLAVVGFSWMVAVDLMPAGARPYIGSSTNNTVSDLVFGYNGLGRLFGQAEVISPGLGGGGGGFPGGGRAGGGVPGGGGGAGVLGGQTGLGRMFDASVGGQISWLLPLAAVGLLAALVVYGRGRRTDPRRAGVILWGGGLVTTFLVFSFAAGIWHPYYTVALAPFIAASVGIGTVALLRLFRTSRTWVWVLPAALAATGVWAIVLLQRSPDFLPWLWPLIALGLVVGSGGLIVARAMGRQRGRLVAGALSVALLAVLAGPAAYAATPLGTPVSTTFPSAGPATISLGPGSPGGGPAMRRSGFRRPHGGGGGGRGPGAPFGQGATTTNTAALDRYLVQHRGSATWIVAVVGSMVAAPIILDTGRPVMAMGGYNGNDPMPTAGELSAYVAGGELKYVLLTAGSMFGPPGVIPWVTSHCKTVDPTAYGGASGGNSTLYACGSR